MTKSNKKGFTIIEVVLVLAIAGLIFLMVFIALPALQRSQRNTQREQDIARFLTAINNYQSNNSGKTPWKGTTGAQDQANLVKRYICADGTSTTCEAFNDPDGTSYAFENKGVVTSATVNITLTTLDHKVYVYQQATCGDTETQIKKGSGAREIALVYVLEGGSIACNDNH